MPWLLRATRSAADQASAVGAPADLAPLLIFSAGDLLQVRKRHNQEDMKQWLYGDVVGMFLLYFSLRAR